MYPTLFSNTHMVSKPSIYSSTNCFFWKEIHHYQCILPQHYLTMTDSKCLTTEIQAESCQRAQKEHLTFTK